ncbi:DUF6894 family protein [Methylobacterium planeticum]|uniref:DUF6894 domain-containing protein n=1 Tax=Methylobacterium planeticum TaxID=2615211 RepID=A0A6N6MLZ7_9HYPH|nr:hypothetical protein [Methylobacterium planeticum]KAB1071749.1 hypothetical protein F6X51_18225 [Methylobacterium planeticum]
MPQRFHFRLVSAQDVIEDPVGALAEDIEEAQAEALSAIEELRRQGDMSDVIGGWNLEIRSESGVLLRSIEIP